MIVLRIKIDCRLPIIESRQRLQQIEFGRKSNTDFLQNAILVPQKAKPAKRAAKRLSE